MKGKSFVLVAMVAALLMAPGPASAEYTWHTYNGHFYALTEGRYWGIQDEAPNIFQPDCFDAQGEAEAIGGHLVTINDAAENAWLAETFTGDEFWTGFTDWRSEGSWRWFSGEAVTYTNWQYPPQPDNGAGGEDSATLHHFVYGSPWGDPGEWNDLGNIGYGGDPPYSNHPNLPICGIIEVIPEPVTLSLLAVGGLGLIWGRRP